MSFLLAKHVFYLFFIGQLENLTHPVLNKGQDIPTRLECNSGYAASLWKNTRWKLIYIYIERDLEKNTSREKTKNPPKQCWVHICIIYSYMCWVTEKLYV